ncbi:hypothetical protein EDD22DRAFT_852686 [Suillus occidentalis]|nr:hypothetical protein EDD22DRAFT_852686 [Suillus occidentalis]
MSTDSNPVIALANAAFRHVGDKVEHMVGQALQLEAADPKHINIAVEMAHALSHVFSVYALQTTAVPPMVLSAAAELQEHLDSSFYKVVSTPVWTNIRPDDSPQQDQPTVPKPPPPSPPPPPPPPPPALLPRPKRTQKMNVAANGACAKRPRAMSVVAAPKSKRQRAKSKSKAIITSDDDMELDNAVPAGGPSASAGTRQRPGPHYVEIDELEEDTIVGLAPKMGPPYVDIPYSPPQRLPRRLPLQPQVFKRTTSPSPAPRSGRLPVVPVLSGSWSAARDTTPQTTHWQCALRCHRAKHKCGGKGSIASNKGRRPAANRTRSKSRRRTSTANLTVVTDDEAAAEEAPAEAVTAATAAHCSGSKEEMAVLRAMVASLADRVSTGEQLLQESNRRLAEQEANAKLLRQASQRKKLPAAATATQEEQEQLPCVATAPEQAAAQQDEIPAVTAMQVDEFAGQW